MKALWGTIAGAALAAGLIAFGIVTTLYRHITYDVFYDEPDQEPDTLP